MSKPKTSYSCSECGAISLQWNGQCSDCEAWNSLVEIVSVPSNKNANRSRFANYSGEEATVIGMKNVPITHEVRIATGLSELDRVLGGGIVQGSVILIGGDPGIGKSTVLLQTLAHLSNNYTTLYVTGEESLQQVKLRAHRLELSDIKLRLLADTQIERILNTANQEKPQVMVIDSIQTMMTELLQSAPGSVGQVRESAAQLVRFAKQTGIAVFLVGHVTKEGTLAGPRVLEHMVDTVLYFEGEPDNRFRIIRAVKNRFGAVNELGIFTMTDGGLKGVSNPSAIFLSRYSEPASGSIVTVTWEGSRPMLVEVQALVDETHLTNPRRVTVGLDQNRLAIGLAVLHRHGGIITYNQDVFVNIVGGVRVFETAADLPVLLAVLSSLKDRPLPKDLIAFGEVGLAGEIRPVQSGQERLKEAVKHGFKRAIVPLANAPKNPIEGMEVIAVSRLSQALMHC
jgi:DNA repair protein RadA/Sms